jgi:hypothetical protein
MRHSEPSCAEEIKFFNLNRSQNVVLNPVEYNLGGVLYSENQWGRLSQAGSRAIGLACLVCTKSGFDR